LKSSPTKILIELPTWLGDSVMASVAIENIVDYFIEIELTLIGSITSTEIFKNHPKVNEIIIIDKNYLSLLKISNALGKFDIFFTFRNSFRSKLLKFILKASKKYQFNSRKYPKWHQVKKYANFVNDSLNVNLSVGKLVIYRGYVQEKKNRKLLGINPGASYGSAKRWYPNEFAKVVIELSDHFDTIIFGSKNEIDFTNEIEKILILNSINNYRNLAGKTTISELIASMSSLDLFITGDSGPMHVAAALQVPTIAIFGPTNSTETSQWMNSNSVVVSKKLDCQPCMQRSCPLKHHNCMKLISAKEVINSIPTLVQ
jgi:heptosyltransferase II